MGKYNSFYKKKNNSSIFIRKISATTAICGVLSSCAVFPTPFGSYDGKNFQHDLTFDIVEKVRCEARDAMYGAFAKLVEIEYSNWPGTPKLLKDIKENPGSFDEDYFIVDTDPLAQIRSSFFQDSTLKIEFNLQITETNNNKFTPTFTGSGGTHNVQLKLGDQSANVKRFLTRIFSLPKHQFQHFRKISCRKDQNPTVKKVQNSPDAVYPLRGKTDFERSIVAFIRYVSLNTSAQKRDELAKLSYISAYLDAFGLKPLTDEEQKPTKIHSSYDKYKPKNPELLRSLKSCRLDECINEYKCYEGILKSAGNEYNMRIYNSLSLGEGDGMGFSDALEFTTDLITSPTPTLEFSAAAGSFKAKSLALNLNWTRKDIHKLTASFAPAARFTPKQVKSDPVYIKVGGNTSSGYELALKPPQTKTEPTDKRNEYCLKLQHMQQVASFAPLRTSKQLKPRKGNRKPNVGFRNNGSFTESPIPPKQADESALIFNPPTAEQQRQTNQAIQNIEQRQLQLQFLQEFGKEN